MKKVIGRKNFAKCMIILESIIYYIAEEYDYVQSEISKKHNKTIKVHPSVSKNQSLEKGIVMEIQKKDILFFNRYIR